MRALVLVAILLLAGCVQPEAGRADDVATAALAPPEPPAPGRLAVTTLFQDRQPLSDVNVTVGNQSAVSDALGVARFANLTPGAYNVTASKAAHRTALAQVVITPGNLTEATLVLEADAGSQHSHERGLFAHRDKYVFEGRFDCSATYVIVTGDCMILLQNVSEQAHAPPPPALTNSTNVIEFPLDATWSQLAVEMAWTQPAVALEEGMTLALEPAQAPADGHAAKYAVVEGGSPLRIVLKPGVKHETASAQDMPNPAGGEVLRARAFVAGIGHHPAGTDFLGVGVAKDQAFTITVLVDYG